MHARSAKLEWHGKPWMQTSCGDVNEKMKAAGTVYPSKECELLEPVSLHEICLRIVVLIVRALSMGMGMLNTDVALSVKREKGRFLGFAFSYN